MYLWAQANPVGMAALPKTKLANLFPSYGLGACSVSKNWAHTITYMPLPHPLQNGLHPGSPLFQAAPKLDKGYAQGFQFGLVQPIKRLPGVGVLP